jgi:hypothetical protein
VAGRHPSHADWRGALSWSTQAATHWLVQSSTIVALFIPWSGHVLLWGSRSLLCREAAERRPHCKEFSSRNTVRLSSSDFANPGSWNRALSDAIQRKTRRILCLMKRSGLRADAYVQAGMV